MLRQCLLFSLEHVGTCEHSFSRHVLIHAVRQKQEQSQGEAPWWRHVLSSCQAPARAGYSLIVISLLTAFLLHFVHKDLRFMTFDGRGVVIGQ